MFLAHLPAGYLLTKAIQHNTGNESWHLLVAGLIASVFPDLDLFYFYFVDHRQHLHHHYVTHLPMAWLAFAGLAALVLWGWRKRHYLIFVAVILANLLLHMALDSVAASIDWLHPLANGEVTLAEVPAKYSWWVWNFVLHWTFLLEISIITAAFTVGIHSWRKPS